MRKLITISLTVLVLALPVADAWAATNATTKTKKRVVTQKFAGSLVQVDRWGAADEFQLRAAAERRGLLGHGVGGSGHVGSFQGSSAQASDVGWSATPLALRHRQAASASWVGWKAVASRARARAASSSPKSRRATS